jgi:hypothetical protein
VRTFNRINSSFFVLILAMLACQISPAAAPVQPAPTQDLNAIIAATVDAAKTLTALVSTPVPQESPIPTETPTFAIPSTETPTPMVPSTATPAAPMISVSVATNCRSGPGKIYDYLGALLVGQTVEIYAREVTGNYWYIRNPEATEEEYCWIWGNYATIAGDVSVLPVYTPPPTPTATLTSVASITPTITITRPPPSGASFVVSYNNLDTCSGAWHVDLKVRNNGTISYESWSVTIKDLANNEVFDKKSNVFTDLDGCSTFSEKDVVDPGDILLFSGPDISYDPTGHKLRISLTMCESNGQKGICAKQNFDVQL